MKAVYPLILIGLAISATVISCGGCRQIEFGPELTEPATVVDTCYVPAGHGSGMGIGNSSNGDAVATVTSVDIPARYAIVFRCQHGKFVIEDERAEALYRLIDRGDEVVVRYVEKFEVVGKERRIIGLRFLGAERVVKAERP